MDKKKTVLVVVAHGDDMEFLAGGTVARFVDEKGYDVFEYILTDNSKGSYSLSAGELRERSAREAEEAGRVLGLKEVRQEGYPDGLLNEAPPNVVREKIMAMIREVRADVVLGWDPFAPCEEHPDHRVGGMALLEAASFSSIPLYHPEHAHPPYLVTETYWIAKHPWNAELFVDVSGTIDKKIEALLKHETQMELTVDGLRLEAEALGVDAAPFQDSGPEGCRRIIDMGIRSFCAAVGEKAGMPYAEQFRYEKLGMLDRILGNDLVKPDF